ncbi:hypothetical protein ACFSTI_25065 [Rhizorhabdus histidinilytica]|uniref:Uncharacterized protein n=1 Tax=Rhizorhabdus histidinilytica TaxID=439228 RepID=A0A1T5A8Q4_9SPHN|nr:hypothetical protein [Rhizorhabdus histidinilytica]SKB31043.1 hypothetical protein SAMN06295920_101685 [Rhizorhabdus histidinilytica]
MKRKLAFALIWLVAVNLFLVAAYAFTVWEMPPSIDRWPPFNRLLLLTFNTWVVCMVMTYPSFRKAP